jgi:hypothetical protein
MDSRVSATPLARLLRPGMTKIGLIEKANPE